MALLPSGSGARKAAQYQLSTLGQALPQIRNDLTSYAGQGVGAIQSGAGQARAAYGAARPLALDALGQGYGSAQGALGQARTALQGGYDQARADLAPVDSWYQPYANAGQQSLGVYRQSLGLGGPGSAEKAIARFHAGPQYQWLQDQAADQTARGASAAGMLMGGNTFTALQDRAGHLADSAYGGWQDRLQGLAGMGLTATNARAANAGNLANLATDFGRANAGIYGQSAGLYGDEGRALAGVESGYGDDMAGSYMGEGTGIAGLYSGLGNNIANVGTRFAENIANAGAAGYKAEDDAAKDRLNMLLGLGSSLSSLGGLYFGSRKDERKSA